MNKNRKVRRLCDYVLRFEPDFDDPELDKEKVYRHIFREDAYRERRINNVISDLLQHLYGYLAFQQYASRPRRERRFLMAELLDREIHGHIDRNARRYEQLRDKAKGRSYEFFLEEYHYHDLLDRYSLTKGRRGYDANLQLKNDALDRYYLCNKLRIACDMMSRNIVISAGYECHYLEDLLERFRASEADQERFPALRVYYKTYQMLTDLNNEQHYYELKELLHEHISLFPHRELNILYRYALNHCVRQINTGHTHYYREILDVYKLLLKEKIIFENGNLTQWSYINIITAGIRLREYDWTERFIHEYRDHLLPEERHNVYTYNLASLYFEKKEYQRALQQLHDVEFTDTSYHLGAKIIQLKSFFELDETEAFFSLLEAFRKYILRNREISEYRKRANNNFLRLAQQLYQFRLDYKALQARVRKRKARQIHLRLQQTSPLANKEWLQEAFGKTGGADFIE